MAQIYADGFNDLPLDQKILIWHLYRAALAGRDIYYDQRHRLALAIRETLEEILTHAEGIDAAVLGEIERYTKLFWINSGPYNNLTARKFVMRCAPDAFALALRQALANGAQLPDVAGNTPEAVLAALSPMLFDPAVDAVVTNKTPGDGRDILQTSANNLYVGVTMADLDGFEEKYALNSRLVKTPDGLEEEVYRIGGKYDAEIREIVAHLTAALPYAPAPTAAALARAHHLLRDR